MVSPEYISPIKTVHTPELVEKSIAQRKIEIFSETSKKRLALMREIFDSLSPEVPLRVIRNSTDKKRDVILRDAAMRDMDYLGSGDVVSLVSDKNMTGNKNGYSYIHRTVKINGMYVEKIYVKIKTARGKIGYLALEHIGKAETPPDPKKPAEAQPVTEVGKEDPKGVTTVTTLQSGLLIARGPNQSQHPLISQGKMADMVITYE